MKASIRVEAEQVRKALNARNDTAGAVDLRKNSGEACFMKGIKILLILYCLYLVLTPEVCYASTEAERPVDRFEAICKSRQYGSSYRPVNLFR